MKEPLTIDEILSYMEEVSQKRMVLPPSKYLDLVEKLNALRGDEDDRLIELHQEYAQVKVENLNQGKSAAVAEAIAKASDKYKAYKKQEARCERITEFIRIEKIRSRLKDTEFNNY